MRVLYSFPLRLGPAGIGNTAWQHVAALSEAGAEVTVACATNERPLPAGVRVVETMRLAGVKIPLRALGTHRSTALHDRRVATVLERAPFDVVHCWPMGSEQTLIAARRLGVVSLLERPNAYTGFAFDAVEKVCAELGIDVDPASPHARQPEKLAKERREYALADGLLCPSDFVVDTFLAAGVSRDRLFRHRYGYDPVLFNTIDRKAPGGSFTVLFVGRVEPRKGLHYALRAWLDSGAPELGGRFLIAGTVDSSYGTTLEQLLAHPSVESCGYVADPAALMRKSDVLILPTAEEGSALVTYEGRACGCVLVVSNHSGAPCTPGVDALVHPAGDVGILTEHLRSLSEDPALLEQLRRASLDGVEKLTWTASGPVVLEAYEQARKARI